MRQLKQHPGSTSSFLCSFAAIEAVPEATFLSPLTSFLPAGVPDFLGADAGALDVDPEVEPDVDPEPVVPLLYPALQQHLLLQQLYLLS